MITNPYGATLDLDATNFMVEQVNAPGKFEFVNRIAPLTPVAEKSGKYLIFGKEALMDPGNIVRAPLASAVELASSVSRTSYNCEDHSAKEPYALEEEGAARGKYSPEQRAAKRVYERVVMLKRALDVIATASTAGNYSSSNKLALTAGEVWSNKDNSDPIGDVLAMAKAIALGCGADPSEIDMVIGWDVLQDLKVHPQILNRLIYSKGGAVTNADLQNVFEVRSISLASARKATAAGALSFAWPAKTIWLGYNTPSPSLEDVSFAKTFLYTGAPNAVGGIGVQTWDLEPDRKGRVVLVSFWHSDMHIVTTDAGALITY